LNPLQPHILIFPSTFLLPTLHLLQIFAIPVMTPELILSSLLGGIAEVELKNRHKILINNKVIIIFFITSTLTITP
jgi:hypothetical protein